MHAFFGQECAVTGVSLLSVDSGLCTSWAFLL